MELFASGKMTLKLFKLAEPKLRRMSLDEIREFKAQMISQGVNIPDSVMRAFSEIVDEKLIDMIKYRKLNAIFLYQKLH